MTPRDGRWSTPQRVKNDALYGLARVLVRALLATPRSWLPLLGHALGLIAYAVLPRARGTAIANLARVHPTWTTRRCRREGRRIFRTLGACATDTVALLDVDERAERTLDLDRASMQALDGALAHGRGVVFVTCHLGPWERMAALLAAHGYPISTVARESYDPRFQRLIYDPLRARRGVSAIYRGQHGAAVAIVRALRRGRVVGFLMDLPGRHMATIDVELLGCAARVPLGPLRIALRSGAAIVIGSPAPGARGRLCVRIEALATDDLARTDEARLAARVAHALSQRISALPAHWPWMHPSFTGPTLANANRR